MDELYSGGMQEVPLQRCWLSVTRDLPRRAVERIAYHRVAEGGQVDAYLVRTPGFDLDLQQGKLAMLAVNFLEDFPMGDRGAPQPVSPRSPGGHARAPNRITADRSVYRSLRLLQPSMHQGQVRLPHLPCGKLPGQFAVSRVALGDYHQTTRLLVQPMDDPGPKL